MWQCSSGGRLSNVNPDVSDMAPDRSGAALR
jgi:hypothetical protein